MAMSISANGSQWVELGNEMDLMIPSAPLVVERTEKVSFSFGDLSVRQIGLPDIYIVHGDMFFKHRKLHFRASDLPEMVELHFALTGGGTIHNHISNQSHTFQPRMQNMFYMPHLNGTGEYLTNKNYQFFEVHFTKEKFLSLVKDFGPRLQGFADDIVAGRYTQLSKDNLPISFAMNSCIQDIIHCPYSGGLKLLFLQSKSIELLVLQAEAFEQAASNKNGSVLKSPHDKELIYQAKDYLVQHADTPPGLPELARLVGTNEFKLKKGFKELFDNSVFGYLSDYKLERASELLLSGAPIKQVVADLGYSSVQHFSLAFKKKYGMTPGSINN
jgi:AraC family transcriptional activator of pyochelin receptor